MTDPWRGDRLALTSHQTRVLDGRDDAGPVPSCPEDGQAGPSLLTLWLPLRLVNPLNGAHGHWSVQAKRRQSHRIQTRLEVASALRGAGLTWRPEQPKQIRFTAHLWNLMDDDALPAACKSVRDGLIDARVIHDDGPRSGHAFVYRQVVDRKRRGVEVEVEVAAAAAWQG